MEPDKKEIFVIWYDQEEANEGRSDLQPAEKSLKVCKSRAVMDRFGLRQTPLTCAILKSPGIGSSARQAGLFSHEQPEK